MRSIGHCDEEDEESSGVTAQNAVVSIEMREAGGGKPALRILADLRLIG